MSPHSLRKAIAVAGVAALFAFTAGCSSSKAVKGATETTSAAATTTEVATTVAPPVTDTPATDAPTTLAPATTAPPAPAGWTAIDPANTPGPLAFPCCASNWTGVASPALPSAGGTLADGIYSIRFDWPSDFSQPVTATVSRFELCSTLPAGSCEDNGGGSYAADELGVDSTATFTLPLTFDDQLHVVLGGFRNWDSPAFATGNGLDIASLVTALDADYQVAIMQPFTGGATQDQIAANLTATPANGFSAPEAEGAGALVYTHDGCPPLLFQGLVGFDDTPLDTRGSDIIGRIALVVSGGQLTINLYSGFYS